MNKQPTVSEVLRAELGRPDRSLRDIARATGVDAGRLSRFVRMERGLTTEAVDKLAQELGLTLVSLQRRKRGSGGPRYPKE